MQGMEEARRMLSMSTHRKLHSQLAGRCPLSLALVHKDMEKLNGRYCYTN